MVCVRPGAVVDDDDGFNEIILSISQIFFEFFEFFKIDFVRVCHFLYR